MRTVLVRVQPPQPTFPSERKGLHRLLGWCTPHVPRWTQFLFRAWVTSNDLFHAKGFRRALVWWPTSEIAIQNRLSIETRERALSTEEIVCKALTCAIYNLCYAKSMEEGRETGFLIHPPLAVRARAPI